MSFSKIAVTALFLLPAIINSQNAATSSDAVTKGLEVKTEKQKNSVVKNVPFRNIGPSIMSGRVVDLDVNPDNSTEFYVGYASGGLWYTNNNGTTFKPVIDSTNTQNVGEIAVDWKNGTIWVGTGENNASRSSYAGIGILKSTDKGKSWQNMGLKDSQHIGKILINPNNPDEVVVGVTGHLYSPNKERGVYKTTDGGKSWKQTLFVDDMSGIIDMQHSPNNFDVMFASSWTKDRKAWNFDGNGENSAIYKSTDGGDNWTKISTPESGFPTGTGVGRIGFAVYDDNTVYAIHDSQFRREEADDKAESRGLSKEDFKDMDVQTFLKLEDAKLDTFLEDNGFQDKYKAKSVKDMVKGNTVKPADLAKYLEDANALLFDSPVIGAEIYKSTDGGKSWKKTHDGFLEDLYYSYGYYFGHVHVSPENPDHIYTYGVPILKSKDGGKTFESIDGPNVHSDHHALWIDPKNPNHLINGNDGGINISYDDGENWIKNNSPSVGQFYFINTDNEKPYNVYGGLQDNGVWVGPHTATESARWYDSGQYPWESIMGGDGMQVQIDNRDANIVYTGFQFGSYYRLNRKTNERTSIQPKHELGENPYRFNWQSPILLSPHNQDIVYFGANKLFRSLDKGDNWNAISEDLTKGGKKGNVAYGTLTTISESPFQFGLIYTGSDDGNINVTMDGGASWKNVSTKLPAELWVSRVVASAHKKERVYASLNGYRSDDFRVYLYKSEDFGNTWTSISDDIPMSPVNVITEDPANENILYVGTDNGAYVSFNMGNSWEAFSSGLPSVAVHDIKVQAGQKDLLLGTHGRSIYIADIEALQGMNESKMNEDLVVFNVDDVRGSSRWGSKWGEWYDSFEPSINIGYYSKNSGKKKIQIKSDKGTILKEIDADAAKGFNYIDYDLSISEDSQKKLMKENPSIEIKKADNKKYYLPKGTYTIAIAGKETKFEIK
ncbi:Sortilin, neurotensin receptor 3 [Flavobacteriaceae bacterium MAR_2010_188]|nr:Sortilin, neurotensin receptor 3 [Flavobacteriaceae bacterium MAR_2010_188]